MKYVIERIEPERLRKLVKREIEIKGKRGYQTRIALFPLISSLVMGRDFWRRNMEIDERKKVSNWGGQESKPVQR